MGKLTNSKKLLIVTIVFSIVVANILHKKYDDYTIYFVIPMVIIMSCLILKVISENKTNHSTFRNIKVFIIGALIINLVIGYFIFNSK